jgi:hypothetical protein
VKTLQNQYNRNTDGKQQTSSFNAGQLIQIHDGSDEASSTSLLNGGGMIPPICSELLNTLS